jgi:hypothetical protein
MLNSETFNSAITLATKLSESNVAAIPAPNTVLSELTRLSVTPNNIETTEANLDASVPNSEYYGDLIEYYTTGTLEDPSEHTLEMSGFATDLAKYVTAHISFAKNVVKPKISEFSNELIAYIERSGNVEPSSIFEIKSVVIPAILKDSFFLESISKYRDTKFSYPNNNFKLPTMTHDELVDLISTGDKKTDKLVTEWLDAQDADFLTAIWASVFTTQDYSTIQGIAITDTSNEFEEANRTLAIYLIARKLVDFVIEGTEHTLIAYRRLANEYHDYYAASLAATLKRISLLNTTKQLVLSINTPNKSAVVNGELFPEWLASGGNTEVILGLIVSGEKLYNVTLIDSKRDAFKAQWNSYYTYAKTANSNKLFYDFKNNVKYVSSLLVEKSVKDGEEYFKDNAASIPTIYKLIDAEVDKLTIQDMSNIEAVSRTIVAKCIYSHTSAYNILTDMVNAATVNPDIDPREAALLAAINYISDYLVDQIALSK